jgi:Tol biopolymer transport system component
MLPSDNINKVVLPNQNRSKKLIPTIAVVIVLILVIIGGYVYYYKDKYGDGISVQTNLSGTIYMVLYPNGTHEGSLYFIDAATSRLGILNSAQPQNDVEPVTGHFSPAGDMHAFSMKASGDANSQIYIGSLKKTSPTLTKLTTSDVPFKRNPVWSNDGNLIAYVAGTDPRTGNIEAEASSVYVVPVNDPSQDKKVAMGSNPVFTKSGYLLYIKDTGVYEMDLSTQKETLVWVMPGDTINSFSELAISANGKEIAWSNPNSGNLYIADIVSESPFTIKSRRVVHIVGRNPVFSPDGQYVLVAVPKADSELHETKIQITAIPLGEGAPFGVYYLKSFNGVNSSLSDWR